MITNIGHRQVTLLSTGLNILLRVASSHSLVHMIPTVFALVCFIMRVGFSFQLRKLGMMHMQGAWSLKYSFQSVFSTWPANHSVNSSRTNFSPNDTREGLV